MEANIRNTITGVILAGGQARRMGGQDKGLIMLSGKPLVSYVIASLCRQVGSLIINANRNLVEYRSFGCPVVADATAGFHGPLAGIASCMAFAKTELMVCVPCDSPFITGDLVDRLYLALNNNEADICMAHNGERTQPVFSLLRTSLLASLQEYLEGGGRKIDRWFDQHKFAVADFSDKPDTFMNINTPEDIAQATALLTADED